MRPLLPLHVLRLLVDGGTTDEKISSATLLGAKFLQHDEEASTQFANNCFLVLSFTTRSFLPAMYLLDLFLHDSTFSRLAFSKFCCYPRLEKKELKRHEPSSPLPTAEEKKKKKREGASSLVPPPRPLGRKKGVLCLQLTQVGSQVGSSRISSLIKLDLQLAPAEFPTDSCRLPAASLAGSSQAEPFSNEAIFEPSSHSEAGFPLGASS
ncbi:hypothetical protein Cni_G13714 [Canna indica]|uniref:Uncharacterized protein n=1 Tax=Canna indica TaxID=4628 RepID=A0AAQ3KG99_9LILI|nr:hypothetical protein Cni_G13714 [Canna indica]